MELVESSQGNTAVTSRLVGGETSEPVFRLNLPSGFSVVVDDVDAGSHEQLQLEAEERLEPQPQPRAKTPEGQDAPAEEQPPDARIRQIQVEAESRKSEFARLLEEHAQVVMQLKQMESDEAVLPPPTTTTTSA